MQNTTPNSNAMRRIRAKPPNQKEKKKVALPSHQMKILCRSLEDVKKGCKDIITEVERILNYHVFEEMNLRIMKVKAEERAMGKRRTPFKLIVTFEFEECTKSEAHCLFSAKPIVLPAPNIAMMINLMNVSVYTANQDRTADFGGRSLGADVTFFDSFKTERFSDEKAMRSLQITFAAGQREADSEKDTSLEGTSLLAFALKSTQDPTRSQGD